MLRGKLKLYIDVIELSILEVNGMFIGKCLYIFFFL